MLSYDDVEFVEYSNQLKLTVSSVIKVWSHEVRDLE